MTDIIATPLVAPEFQFVDADGEVLVGGKVYSFEAGLSTPKVTYTDSTNDTPNTNPVILDNFGKAAIYLKGTYKIVVKDKDDNLIYTQDNISAYAFYNFTGLTATIPDLNSTTTTAFFVDVDYPIVIGDRGKTVLVDASAANKNVQLLPIGTTGLDNKYKIIIKKVDLSTNKVNINATPPAEIEKDTLFILHDYGDFVELHFDGSDWNIVASQQRGTVIGVTPASIPTITLKDNGNTYNGNTSTGNIVITLPDTSVVGKGFTLTFKRTTLDGQKLTINPVGGQLIDNNTNLIFENANSEIGLQGTTIKVDGTNWTVINYLNALAYYDDVRLSSSPTGSTIKDPTTAWDFSGGNAGDIVQQFTYTPLFKNSMLDISFDYNIFVESSIDGACSVGIALFENSSLLQKGIEQQINIGSGGFPYRFLLNRNIHSLQKGGATITYTIQIKVDVTNGTTSWTIDDIVDMRSGVTIREYI